MEKRNYFKAALIFLILLFVLLFFALKNHSFEASEVYEKMIPTESVIKGESCLQCHKNTKGYSEYHNPEFIGCYSCHLGNIKSINKDDAHKGMVLIPGNLSDASETCGKCHPDELHKIKKSLMTTNSGIIAVDKYVFGETETPDETFHIKNIHHSASEKHIRDLCANCHLGAEKTAFGEINQMSRGGGCNACHLNYSKEAKLDLEVYLSSNKQKLPTYHPATDINVNNTHCFGCHSRSSRISTNYEGLQETLLTPNEVYGKTEYSILQDERVYKYLEADVHYNRGLLCIDCHSSHEVMGDGKTYAHEEKAVTLQCADCHFKEKPNTVGFDSLDKESALVFLHRKYSHSDKQMIAVEKDQHPLVNTYVDTLGKVFLIGKNDGVIHSINPQAKVCSKDKAHENVSCASCHSSWAPRCIGCHNEFDDNESKAFDLLDKKFVKGQWKEFVAEFSAALPAMGVRENDGDKRIEPAIPGMILTIDKGSYAGKKKGEDVSFHRLYAPNSPHTTSKKVRNCKSCHASSATLGYGNGELTYDIVENKGIWRFIPEYAVNLNDHLPEDAWIPFLKETDSTVMNSTRPDFRPFTVSEQKRLLTVGACLQCHKDESKVMKQTIDLGLDLVLKQRKKTCVLPVFSQ
jgi:hypothetical protein